MNEVTQSFIPTLQRRIRVREFSRRQAGNAATLLQSSGESYLGLSLRLSSTGEVDLLALATPIEVYMIAAETQKPGFFPNDGPFETLISGESGTTLVGFDMGRIAIHVWRDLKLQCGGKDLSTLFSKTTREPWGAAKFVSERMDNSANKFDIGDLFLWSGRFEQTTKEVCLRAWISACAAGRAETELGHALKVNTSFLDTKELICISELISQAVLIEGFKPKDVPNEFSKAVLTKDGNLRLTNSRYRNRVRASKQASVIMTNTDGREFTGRAHRADGKTTGIKFSGARLSGTLSSVRVVGRQDPTNSEKAREELVLLLLRREKSLQSYFFIRKLWFPSRRNAGQRENTEARSLSDSNHLNASQAKVVSVMLSDTSLVIVHGPPGTGKTTTISAAASIWDRNAKSTWIVAHSNVAVKNIAERLFKDNVDFKLIVSKEFHFEWHEHIYTLIKDRIIRGDDLTIEEKDTKKIIGTSRIILSTLSMLVNPGLDASGIFNLVPVNRLVIDEASQINIFDFMPVFAKFDKLQKLCFFGDPKQLPPYGQDRVPTLKTIFDIDHLRNSDHLLDTQYRMPVPLGQFISKYVYEGKLHSSHHITHLSCVAFVDVSNSQETSGGFSWKNPEEIRTIVHLVKHYYKHRDFCVITPYDAQRAAIEKELKDQDLPWERVFNVDSFQGNEAKYVLVSVVRSGGPGFLTSLNRMNVMLTRCQAGLVVVTSRQFLENGGRTTLLGNLARYWENLRTETWVNWKLVAEANVDLPGAPGRSRDLRSQANVGQSRVFHPSTNAPPTPFEFIQLQHNYNYRGVSIRYPGPVYPTYSGRQALYGQPPPPSSRPSSHYFAYSSPFETHSSSQRQREAPIQSYDASFPVLIPTPASVSASAKKVNPHSHLWRKPEPIYPNQPKQNRPPEPQIKNRGPAPVTFVPSPEPPPKSPEDEWKTVSNKRGKKKIVLTPSSYKL